MSYALMTLVLTSPQLSTVDSYVELRWDPIIRLFTYAITFFFGFHPAFSQDGQVYKSLTPARAKMAASPWDGLDLDVELPGPCEGAHRETCLTEVWNASMCNVPWCHITDSPPRVHSPVASPVNSHVAVVFDLICKHHHTVCIDGLLAEFSIMQCSPEYKHVRELSLKVIAAGAVHICTLRRFGLCLATKDICSACGLTPPTVRKAVSVFNELYL